MLSGVRLSGSDEFDRSARHNWSLRAGRLRSFQDLTWRVMRVLYRVGIALTSCSCSDSGDVNSLRILRRRIPFMLAGPAGDQTVRFHQLSRGYPTLARTSDYDSRHGLGTKSALDDTRSHIVAAKGHTTVLPAG
ncbi:MAG TPA: hypothetical protein VFW30_09275 [Bryocella sp.]|nr:hypothetical protein [Bryocella sp.]